MALSQRTQGRSLGCRSTSRQPRCIARLGAASSSTRPAVPRRSGAVNVTNSLFGARCVRSQRCFRQQGQSREFVLPCPTHHPAFIHASRRGSAAACKRSHMTQPIPHHAAGVLAGCPREWVPLHTRMVGHNCSHRARAGAPSGQGPSQLGPTLQHRCLCVAGASSSLLHW